MRILDSEIRAIITKREQARLEQALQKFLGGWVTWECYKNGDSFHLSDVFSNNCRFDIVEYQLDRGDWYQTIFDVCEKNSKLLVLEECNPDFIQWYTAYEDFK